MNIQTGKTIVCDDNNIDEIRQRYPGGLHFVVGDLHGQANTLADLMDKIRFDPDRDFVYFVGDYNGGGNATFLIKYMSKYYQEKNDLPGFHMIRGNHEREEHLNPVYPLKNLPDIMVIRGNNLNFYITHAGMESTAFDLINSDIDSEPERKVFAYRLDEKSCMHNARLKQITWSKDGFYSQHSHWQRWPAEYKLIDRKSCIIHGHTPYCYFLNAGKDSYGDDNLFWEKQHIWFCKELHSFNIDSDIKGKNKNGETYRGLSCLCLEVYDELASKGNGTLTVDMLRKAENGVFAAELAELMGDVPAGDLDVILRAAPEMKTITLDSNGMLSIRN